MRYKISKKDIAMLDLYKGKVMAISQTAKYKFRLYCKDSDGKRHFFKKIPHKYFASVKVDGDGLPSIVVENREVLTEKELFGLMLDGTITEVIE